MLNIQGELFKIVRPRGELLLGRVVSVGYLGGNLSKAAFRLHKDHAQLLSGEDVHLNQVQTIEDGRMIVVQRVLRDNQGEPSTYERILQLNTRIQAFKDDYHYYGIIVSNLPDNNPGALSSFVHHGKTQESVPQLFFNYGQFLRRNRLKNAQRKVRVNHIPQTLDLSHGSRNVPSIERFIDTIILGNNIRRRYPNQHSTIGQLIPPPVYLRSRSYTN
jgi:hypothetical protein